MWKMLRNLCAVILAESLIALGYCRRAAQAIRPGDILPLCFHNPTPPVFQRLIAWLKNEGYTFISSENLLDIMNGREFLDCKAVWISFDDGWRDTLHTVVPALVEADIPATFFLITDPIVDPRGVFWWSLLRANQRYLPDRYRRDIECIWEIPEEERTRLIHEIYSKNPHQVPRQALSVPEVQGLARLPQITIGSHTAQHRLATHYNAPDLEAELLKSKQLLRAWSGKPARFFAYPKGVYDPSVVEIIRRAGFDLAATTEAAILTRETHTEYTRFRLPRIPIPDEGFFPEIMCHTLGVWQPFIRKAKWAFWLDPHAIIHHHKGY